MLAGFKARAVAAPVLGSALLTCVLGGLLPPLIGAAVFLAGSAITVVLAVGAEEDLAVAVLLRGRRLSPAQAATLTPVMTILCRAGLGPPVIRVWVRPGRYQVAAIGAGRRSVVLSTGLVEALQDGRLPPEEAAAVIAHAAAVVRAGLVRRDLLLGWVMLPWQILHAITAAAAAPFAALPGLVGAWRLRIVVAGIAVAQMSTPGHWPLAVLIAAIAALSYAGPHWARRWDQLVITIGDEQVCRRGFGPPLARFLRRLPRTPQLRERLTHLEAPAHARPALGAVNPPPDSPPPRLHNAGAGIVARSTPVIARGQGACEGQGRSVSRTPCFVRALLLTGRLPTNLCVRRGPAGRPRRTPLAAAVAAMRRACVAGGLPRRSAAAR